jgi:hypothetical protein
MRPGLDPQTVCEEIRVPEPVLGRPDDTTRQRARQQTNEAREIRDKKLAELNGKKNAAQAERTTLQEFRDCHNRRYENEKKRFEAADDYLTDLKKNPSYIPEIKQPR